MKMARKRMDRTIEISRMNTSSDNNDYTMGGSEKLQASLTDLITEYEDIFNYSVKE